MRHRARPNRTPSDREREAAIRAEAARLAHAGNTAAARIALRALNDLALTRDFAIAEHRGRPPHPMRARQRTMATNAMRRKLGSDRILGLVPVVRHPTKSDVRAHARCISVSSS